MTGPSASGQLPSSGALAEATVDSLSDLFSRDPEGYSDKEFGQVVLELRAQRVRHAAAEATALTSGGKPKAVAGKAKSLVTTKNSEDMGL